ncbi:hypothetical protein V7S57_02210 [Caulobacter sp. CCNWLY153]|uniref:hypothetical protein n=1 Tax=unclassified Caulobacter TaxID=2648921 RepID=UPI002FF06828
MRERPILFSAPMVRALLTGEKTQTRRTMKVQPVLRSGVWELFGTGWSESIETVPAVTDGAVALNCPYGRLGDRLWVREAIVAEELAGGDDGVRYLADDNWSAIPNTPEAADRWLTLFHYGQSEGSRPSGLRGKGVPSIHMPRWACRLVLEITSIRAERLNACSEADAIAEGSREPSLVPIIGGGWSERDVYARLWEHINGKGSWAANPWVWVVEFKKIDADG